ncbi:MAG: CCA tRNA nucleotidyltransferase [Tuberibacillus sp.]
MSDPFVQAKTILKRLIQSGYETYIVGGSVRDYLLSAPIHDIDIATSATPQEIMSVFPETFPVGIQHGTVLVRHNKVNYEVTTFRSESGYQDFRHPDRVTFETSIIKDLARRDFTINAMAMDINGEILDPFKGRDDLKGRMLRTVGVAEERFSEDPLRMLRAVRLTAQLDLCPAQELEKAMIRVAPYIKHLAIERIREEVTKLLSAPFLRKGMELFIRSTLAQHIPAFPESVVRIMDIPFQNMESDAERWALFLLATETADPDGFLKAWRFSNKAQHAVLTILRCFNAQKLCGWDPLSIYRWGLQAALSVEKLKKAMGLKRESAERIHRLWEGLTITNRSELAVDGNDLCRWLHKKGGPWTGKMIEQIERMVILGELENDPSAIRRWVESVN